MQVLNQAEITSLSFKKTKTKDSKAYKFYREMSLLELGQGLLITKAEWPLAGKPAPNNIPKRLHTSRMKFRVNELADASGWVVTRIV